MPLAQQHPDLVAQGPHLVANRAQVAAVLKGPGQQLGLGVPQGRLLQVVKAIGDLLQHRKQLIEQFIHQKVEDVI